MNRFEPVVMVAALCAHLALPACAGSERDATPDEGAATTGSEAPQARSEDGMQIEGILGTISEQAIQDGIQRSLPRISRCFSERYDTVEVLGGHITMAFRIKMDGNVRWVYLRDSTVGDRETERCILNVLSRIQFRRPHGGEAEFVTPLDLDPPEDIRPPVEWRPSRVAELVSAEGATLLARCNARGQAFHVTVYVAPGGEAIAAGAAAEARDMDEPLDCVAEGVRSWAWPDPGSYPAKVSFDLP